MREKVTCLLQWLTDLKSGEAVKHQPKRNMYHSEWFIKQREKEGNPVKD